MIGKNTLEELCNKYGIDAGKIITKNNNILDMGTYREIDRTLDYLINELKVDQKNIEKCPSILYRSTNNIKGNIEFLKTTKVNFPDIVTCLHVLESDPNSLKDTYNYVLENYGINSINKVTSVLAVNKEIIKEVENLNIKENNKDGNLLIASSIYFGYTTIDEVRKIINSDEYRDHPELFTSRTLAHAKISDIKDILHSEEYMEHPELFTSTTLAEAKISDIKEILYSKEYREHPELFTSQTLAYAKISDIKEILRSREYRDHPELFTSQTLAHAKISDIKEILRSREYKEHPELFTSQTLAHAKISDIKEILHSEEYREHPELFTSQTLAHAKISDIKEILHSKEYKEHPELFTSTTIANAKISEIKEILHSKEYKEHPELFTSQTITHAKISDIKEILHSEEYHEHPELFTSTTIANAKMSDIKEILHSEEYREHPELFTSQTLAQAKLADIRKFLSLDCWRDDKYGKLLTSSLVAKSKSMIKKMPIQIKIAEKYNIDYFLNTTFLFYPPSRNYALINYLNEKDIPLVEDRKLNSLFSYQNSVLLKKYNIDVKELIRKYPIEDLEKEDERRIVK